MKLIQHIYAVKGLLAHGPASDDFTFSDRFIAHHLQIARSRLIEQKIDRYYFISEQSYQDLCVDLAMSSFHECCGTEEFTDCKVMKSVAKIPKFLNSRWGNHLKVTDLSGNLISELNITQNKYSKYAINPVTTG
jgi:ankyrin repeat protein